MRESENAISGREGKAGRRGFRVEGTGQHPRPDPMLIGRDLDGEI